MKRRILGKTGYPISEVSLGTWQLGGKWGAPFQAELAAQTLQAAVDCGINCFDTADIYQGGESERAIGAFAKQHPERLYVITKVGRKLDPHTTQGYNEAQLRPYIEQSLERLGCSSLDLVLLHCPPSEVYQNKALFAAMDRMKAEGLIAHYGVSVEKVDEAIQAMDYDISAVEIIFNMFRLKPTEQFFDQALRQQVGIIARVPLASGLLTGNYQPDTTFGADDHRHYNREGAFFDKGETFSGVDYATGVAAAADIKAALGVAQLAPYALRFVLQHEAVSTVIPGASTPQQIVQNAAASSLPDLTEAQMAFVRQVYQERIRPQVHHLW